jgi:hypothetical protein
MAVEAHTWLSRRERQIMDSLYRRGRATVSDVLADLPDPPRRLLLLRLAGAMAHRRLLVGFERDALGIRPKSLEVVVIALLRLEDVNDEVHVVQEDPAALSFALSSERLDLSARQSVFDLLGDGPDLTIRLAATDQEVVRNLEQAGHVEDDDPLGLLIRGSRRSLGDPFPRFRRYVRKKSFPTTIVRSTIPCCWAETCTCPTPRRSLARCARSLPTAVRS